jgi:prepilin-type N-terminal cleavage/methylation domain-containing protein
MFGNTHGLGTRRACFNMVKGVYYYAGQGAEDMKRNNRGFTLIELIIVLAMLAILAFITIPRLTAAVIRAQLAADIANVKVLNDTTAAYAAYRDIPVSDVFSAASTDAARMQVLVDAGFLSEAPQPQEKDAAFEWDTGSQTWVLRIAGETATNPAQGST